MTLCRSCRYLEVPPNKTGRVVPRKDQAYRCSVPLPQYRFPASVTTRHGFDGSLPKRRMDPEEGQDCPFWELRKKRSN